jgi:4'-phosphopantetheinyl transferase
MIVNPHIPSFNLTPRCIHVWSIRNEADDASAAVYAALLSGEEQARAARFQFPHLARAFTLSRGALRFLLARYLDVDPASLRLEYGPKGKPRLPASPLLEFNLSHSGGLATFAFTSGCPIGIDVEQIRPMPDLAAIAHRFFSREEAADLDALPHDQRELAFFLCWTSKEAYIKAVGEGLSAPLDQFRVSVDPVRPAQFLYLPPLATQPWTLGGLSLDDAFAAALAYQDTHREIVMSPILAAADLLRCTEI